MTHALRQAEQACLTALRAVRTEIAQRERDPATPSIVAPPQTAALLTPEQAASIAGRTPDTIRTWCRDRGVGWKAGGRWLVSAERLDVLLTGGEK